jgi:hypothetical protein
MDRAAQLLALKPGDQVALEGGLGNVRIATVDRVTAAQIIIKLKRYRRQDGRLLGPHFGSPYLRGLATKAEIAAFESAEILKRQQQARMERERQSILAKQNELAALFPLRPFGQPLISECDVIRLGRGGTFEVTFRLSEAQVRKLAKRLDS